MRTQVSCAQRLAIFFFFFLLVPAIAELLNDLTYYTYYHVSIEFTTYKCSYVCVYV